MREDLIFYRIYPKSFCDSNADGYGDIQGIKSKISYLKSLGINAILISPTLNCEDSGVIDYYSLLKGFGTTSELQDLMSVLKENDIETVIEIPVIFTSINHAWFNNARKDITSKYFDYYYFSESIPNKWKNNKRECAWAFDSQINRYYYHSTDVDSPDLNWDNNELREEFKRIFKFYIALGVSGFVFGPVDKLAKNVKKGKLKDKKKVVSYLHEIFDEKEFSNTILIGKSRTNSFGEESYLSKKGKGVFDLMFTTKHLCLEKADVYGGAFNNKKKQSRFPIKLFFTKIKKKIWDTFEVGVYYALYFESDQLPRSVSRICDDEENFRYQCATMLGANLLLQRGIPFIYQGEEIGITNGIYDDIKCFKDKKTLSLYEKYNEKMAFSKLMRALNMGSADNSRRFISWTKQGNKKAWIDDYQKREYINLEKDMSDKNSVSAFYKGLIELRKTSLAITRGSYRVIKLTNKCYVYKRKYKGEEIIVINAFDNALKINLNKYLKYDLLLTNYNEVTNILMPYQTVVFRKEKNRK